MVQNNFAMYIRKHTSITLLQVSEVIQLLNDNQYAKPLDVLPDNSVGKHIRHVVEFYQCLLNGLKDGIIDYDSRERNNLIETDMAYTQKVIEDIINAIDVTNNKKMLLKITYGENSFTIPTSFLRELVYNIEHTIHHLAIIKIGIKSHFPSLVLPENLGVAHSTIKYQQQVSLK